MTGYGSESPEAFQRAWNLKAARRPGRPQAPGRPAARPWTEAQRALWLASLAAAEGRRFETKEPDDEWRARTAATPAISTKQQTLNDRLTAMGGWQVTRPPCEEDIGRILARGVLIDGAGATQVRGVQSDCHRNSVLFWMVRKGKTAVMSGYALSDDGVWRQHSWVAAGSGTGQVTMVETTELRVAYFGYLLSPDEAELMFYENT